MLLLGHNAVLHPSVPDERSAPTWWKDFFQCTPWSIKTTSENHCEWFYFNVKFKSNTEISTLYRGALSSGEGNTICCCGGVFVLFLFAYFLFKRPKYSHTLFWRCIHSHQYTSSHSLGRVLLIECGPLSRLHIVTHLNVRLWCYTANEKGPKGPSLPRCPWPCLDTNKLPLRHGLHLTVPGEARPIRPTHQPRVSLQWGAWTSTLKASPEGTHSN